MNLLDENFPEDQRPLLRKWHIPHRQIGRDFSHFGIQDTDIIPLLHQLRRVTLFTQDEDWHAFAAVELGHAFSQLLFQLFR